MPNSPSAAKRMRQSAKRRKRNRVTKKVIKTLSKRTMTALAAKDFNQALDRFEGCFVQDRQGWRSPRSAPQHRGPPQEQAGPCLRRGPGEVEAGMSSGFEEPLRPTAIEPSGAELSDVRPDAGSVRKSISSCRPSKTPSPRFARHLVERFRRRRPSEPSGKSRSRR